MCNIKKKIWEGLHQRGIPVWHANFELINSLSFFAKGNWADWILRGDINRVSANYTSEFPNAKKVYDQVGIGLGMMNFLSSNNIKHLQRSIMLVIIEEGL